MAWSASWTVWVCNWYVLVETPPDRTWCAKAVSSSIWVSLLICCKLGWTVENLKASHACQADQKRNLSHLVDTATLFPISKCFWHKAEKSLDVSLLLHLNNVHEVFCDKWRVIEKVKRNVLWSVECFQKAKVVITLSSPEIWSMASNPDWHTCIRVAKTFRMLEAIGEVLVQNLYIW